jgi:alpha-glucoside transport system substrate-binding protein
MQVHRADAGWPARSGGAPGRWLRRVALAMAVATVLAGCASTPGGTPGPVPTLTGACAPYQEYAGHAGTTVTMYSVNLSPESDHLQSSWAEFSECTGIQIEHEGSNDFEAQLTVRVAGGNAPDLAIIPQPGLLQQVVKSGSVVRPPARTEANVDRYWNEAWKAYGSVDGTFYAAPTSAAMKSLVWYSPESFQEGGYEIPTTWDELMRLSDTIAATGSKPWCGGIASGTATGWPATDWLEQVVLRSYGGEVYDQWVAHELPFSSPEITGAMRTVEDWMLNPDYVNGGFGDVASIATTTWQDSGKPILTGDCYLLQQVSFYQLQWPAGTTIGPDGDIHAFYLPGIDSSVPTPVVGGGEFLAAFSDRPEVQAVQNYLSTPEWANSRIAVASGWVSANQDVDQSLYTDVIDQLSSRYLTDPEATFRFDASDLMPAAVGAGQEWRSMTAWFGQGESITKVAADIDAAWPTS